MESNISGTVNPTPGRYQHTSLRADDEIRLIRIRSSLGKGTELRCEIVHARLSQKPKYEAISYCWGSNTDLRPLQCNNGILMVTRNLYQALTQSRKRIGGKLVWADAVCINQEDIPERSKQVQIMGRIYSQSTSVRIWLGAEQKDDKLAKKALNELAARSATHVIFSASNTERFFKIDMDLFPSISAEKLQALAHFFERPWFSRSWIIQEAVLAEKGIIRWGRENIEYYSLLGAVFFLSTFNLTPMFTESIDATSTMRLIHIIRAWTRGKGRHEDTIIDIVDNARSLQATDSRDKLFAFIGLSPNPVDRGFVPDYSRRVEEVYTDFAIHCLLKHKDLRLLSFKTSSTMDVPSWVPDWSAPGVSPTRPRSYHFKAGGNTEVRIEFSSDSKELILDGYIVSSLSILSSRMKTDRTISPAAIQFNMAIFVERSAIAWNTFRDWFLEIENLLTHVPDPYHEIEERNVAFGKLLICETNSSGKVSSLPEMMGYDYFKRQMRYTFEALPRMTNLEFREVLSFRSLMPASGRRFCVTEAGYMGWVPPLADDTDIIVLFSGSPDFHVIRPLPDGRFQLIGMCYIQGLMHGEFLNKENLQLRSFCLV